MSEHLLLTDRAHSAWRLSVAPMMDWTDRHCRVLHRLLTAHTRLYTEMVTTGALLHGDVARHLDFSAVEHPVALQLGGSEPDDLAACAKLAQQWGYDEVNLNCGCPSERVQRGAFGACLMAEPELVADGVKAMRDAVDLPVTVKHRIGIDRSESYGFVRDFVGTVHQRGGCTVFIVHARNAWLQGLSPKQNREVPPLRYELAWRLKQDFPALTIAVNGGLVDDEAIAAQLQHVDGVMVGRHAYHEPFAMAGWDARFFGSSQPAPTRDAVEDAYVDYMEGLAARGVPWSHAARHMLGLRNGLPGARRWRQVWSDHRLKGETPRHVSALARTAMAGLAAQAGQEGQGKASDPVLA
jgi:tRNA-dihydrouridine synthase A